MVGASVGLKPKDIYEMELWEFNFYCKGYKEVFFNEQMNLMKLAYTTGMFSRESKNKPKPLESYLDKIDKQFHGNKYKNAPVDKKLSQSIHDKIQRLKEMKQYE